METKHKKYINLKELLIIQKQTVPKTNRLRRTIKLMASRAELINQLAASMGANTVNTKSVDSRYDTKTGTLYSDCSR